MPGPGKQTGAKQEAPTTSQTKAHDTFVNEGERCGGLARHRAGAGDSRMVGRTFRPAPAGVFADAPRVLHRVLGMAEEARGVAEAWNQPTNV